MTEPLDIQAALSLEQEQQDYPILRLAAGRILCERPWLHRTGSIGTGLGQRPALECHKCGEQFPRIGWRREGAFHVVAPGCKIPDPAEGPLEVIAAAMVKLCENYKLADAMVRYHGEGKSHPLHATIDELEYDAMHWWIFKATAAEQIACCIKAMEK